MKKCVTGAVGDVDDGISVLGASVGVGDRGGDGVRLLEVMNQKSDLNPDKKNLR